MKKIPNFVIIGQPKAGTTALYEMLSQHPEIFIVDQGHYFYPDMVKKNSIPTLSREKYLELYNNVSNEKAIGDSSESCFYSSIAPKKIKELNSEMKIIIILREPISWLRSFYQQKYRNLEEKKIIHKAIMSQEYLDKIYYVKYLKNWTTLFPKNNIKVIIHEDFKKNNKETIREIFEFLNIDNAFTPKIKKENVSRTLRFEKMQFFLESIGLKRKRIKKVLPEKAWKCFKKIGYKEKKIKIPNDTKEKIKKTAKKEVEKTDNLLHSKDLLPQNKRLKKEWGYD